MATNLIGKTVKRPGRRADKLNYGTVQNSFVFTYDLNDTVSIETLTSSTIDLGAGNDKLTVRGDTTDSKIIFGWGNDSASFSRFLSSSVIGFKGSDLITVNYAQSSSFMLGEGNDTITFTGAMRSSGYDNIIDGEAGRDSIKLTQFTGDLQLNYRLGFFEIGSFGGTKFKNIEQLILADGVTASIRVSPPNSSTGFITVNGTSGNDTLWAQSYVDVTYSVFGGDGDDTINISGYDATTIDGGNGNDRIILNEEQKLELKDGKWSFGTSQRVIAFENIETVFLTYPNRLYTLGSNGARITTASETGGSFKGTTGTDTIIGTAKDDFFYLYGNQGVDFLDFSAGGKDSLSFDPWSYAAGTTSTVTIASVFGSSRDDIYKSIFSETLKIVGDTRRFNSQNIATSGSLLLTSSFAKTLTFQIDFIATNPT